jgi:spermidine synthase
LSRRTFFLVLYGLSGAAALIFEVTWVRLLTLTLGQTTAAVATVLASFMGGLAAGAALAGRLTPTWTERRALLAYATLEAIVAASAALLPLSLEGLRPLLAWSYGEVGGLPFALLRVTTALLAVAIPAAAMGATFPVCARVVGGDRDVESRVGGLYAANTLGAAAGTAAAGFMLLPAWGLHGATAAGIALNACAAAGAVWLARQPHPLPPPPTVRMAGTRRPRPSASPTWPGVAARVAIAVSGFVALGLEVAWTRALALVLGPTTYAFSAMLTTFITGLAIGSATAARFLRRLGHPLSALGITLSMAALATIGAMWFVGEAPLVMAEAVTQPDADFGSAFFAAAAIAAAVLLPLAIALGAAFPLAVAAGIRTPETSSRDAAMIYAANTAGAIAGSIAAGFLLVPVLGTESTVKLLGVVAAAAGLLMVLFDRSRARRWFVAGGTPAAALAMAVVVPPWNLELWSAGAYKYAPYLRTGDLQSELEAGHLLYYAEGGSGTVTVRRIGGVVSLAVDGKVEASNDADMLTQKLLAHVPLLLHPQPRQVAIVGLGSGVTAGAALRHPVAGVDVIEISPEVVRAASFFEAENGRALDDARMRLIVGDARAHLLYSKRAYDVIISEPSNPWMAGIASLFTREFFAAVERRLVPGGVFCQWAHTYDISSDDLRSIAATFASVFPNATIWLVGEGDVLFVGTKGDTGDDRLANIARGWGEPAVAADLAGTGIRRPFGLLSLVVGGPAALARYASGAPVQTDARRALEFSAPRHAIGRSTRETVAHLRGLVGDLPLPDPVQRVIDDAGAADWRDRGLMLLAAAAPDAAFGDLSRATDLDPHDSAALAGLVRAGALSGKAADVRRRLEGFVAADDENLAARLELSKFLAAEGAFDDAVRVLEHVQRNAASDQVVLEQLASVFGDAGDANRLERVVGELERAAPKSAATLYYGAVLHFLRNRFADAASLGERVVALDPAHARAHNLLGAAYARLGQLDRASAAHEAAVRADPRYPEPYANLGLLALQRGMPAAAKGHFAEALMVGPPSAAAARGLAIALDRLGERERAARVQRLHGLGE